MRLLGHPRTTSILSTPMVTGVVAGVVTAGLIALAAGPAQARRTDSLAVPTTALITMTGHGYGHGHGMSQWGAQGAGLQGRSAEQILAFYYPGTGRARTGGKVSVLITADTSPDVIVKPTTGLVVQALTKKKTFTMAQLRPRATAWRLRPTSSGTAVDYRTGSWHRFTAFRGDAQFSAGGRPITLKVPGGRVPYRGALRATEGDTVNIVPLESYLKGVVPREVPARWTPAAVQAQAVAARTYAAYERDHVSAGRHFEVDDTTRSQVYGGFDAEQPESNTAIRRTRKQVVTYDGAPAFTQFSASNGGWGSAGSQPYLVAQKDPFDAAGGANPHHRWSRTVTDHLLEALWPAIGDLRRIEVPSRDGHGRVGGRADDVVLTGSVGTTTVSGDDFRSLVGLESDWFAFSVA